jgi:hypothetical protein
MLALHLCAHAVHSAVTEAHLNLALRRLGRSHDSAKYLGVGASRWSGVKNGRSDKSINILGPDVCDNLLADCFAEQIVSHAREMKTIMHQYHGFWKVSEQQSAINKNHTLRSRM